MWLENHIGVCRFPVDLSRESAILSTLASLDLKEGSEFVFAYSAALIALAVSLMLLVNIVLACL